MKWHPFLCVVYTVMMKLLGYRYLFFHQLWLSTEHHKHGSVSMLRLAVRPVLFELG